MDRYRIVLPHITHEVYFFFPSSPHAIAKSNMEENRKENCKLRCILYQIIEAS